VIIKKDPSIIQSYLEDSSNLAGGHALEVVIPKDFLEASSFLKEANDQKISVTISGGGTGTSGGRIPFGGAVLSTEKLNKIKTPASGGPKKNKISCEAGVLIKDLKEYAAKKGLFYTYDPTEQSAFIGGTIATNASGARSFKYGSTRESVNALTICLADGSIFKIQRGAIKAKDGKLKFEAGGKNYQIPVPTYKMSKTKNSAGYFAERGMDLIDLFICQEGTLACILEATLKFNPKPEDILSCFAFFETEEEAMHFAMEARDISKAKTRKNEKDIDALSIEYFDKYTLNLIRKKSRNVPDGSKGCVFFEQEISKEKEEAIINGWEGLLTKYGSSLNNTWVAMNDKDRQNLLDIRHSLGESMNEMTKANNFPKVTTDLAVPSDKLEDMMTYYKKVLDALGVQYFLFGHIGDSHIHMNLMPKNETEFTHSKNAAMDFIKKSVSLGGTVSAEHGIGKLRREYLKILYGDDGIKEMLEVKKILDPNLILGRGNIMSL